ncbi:hypothetical protein ACWDPV_18580 [Gordonia sp. NPDC003504]
MKAAVRVLLRQHPRNDASTIIGLQSRWVYAVIAWFVGACLITAGFGAGGVRSWPLFLVVLLLVFTGVGALILAPGDPMGATATAITATMVAVAPALATAACDSPPAVAFGTVGGCVSATCAFMCVRGRVLAAWCAFGASMLGSVGAAWPEATPWLGAQIGSVAVLLMATLFAAIIRPAAREIYALRAQTVREASAAASVAAATAERDGQFARLDEQARQLLETIAAGATLTPAQRFRCRLVEARLRDGIRARALDTPEVVDAVWAARERGATVTLLDDAGAASAQPGAPAESSRDPVLAEMRARLIGLLADVAAGSSITARVHPIGRVPVGTIVVRTADGQHRVDFSGAGDDGGIETTPGQRDSRA